MHRASWYVYLVLAIFVWTPEKQMFVIDSRVDNVWKMVGGRCCLIFFIFNWSFAQKKLFLSFHYEHTDSDCRGLIWHQWPYGGKLPNNWQHDTDFQKHQLILWLAENRCWVFPLVRNDCLSDSMNPMLVNYDKNVHICLRLFPFNSPLSCNETLKFLCSQLLCFTYFSFVCEEGEKITQTLHNIMQCNYPPNNWSLRRNPWIFTECTVGLLIVLWNCEMVKTCLWASQNV